MHRLPCACTESTHLEETSWQQWGRSAIVHSIHSFPCHSRNHFSPYLVLAFTLALNSTHRGPCLTTPPGNQRLVRLTTLFLSHIADEFTDTAGRHEEVFLRRATAVRVQREQLFLQVLLRAAAGVAEGQADGVRAGCIGRSADVDADDLLSRRVPVLQIDHVLPLGAVAESCLWRHEHGAHGTGRVHLGRSLHQVSFMVDKRWR